MSDILSENRYFQRKSIFSTKIDKTCTFGKKNEYLLENRDYSGVSAFLLTNKHFFHAFLTLLWPNRNYHQLEQTF